MIQAVTALAMCGFLVGQGPQVAPGEDLASLQTACDAGTPLACYQLALRYRDGVGVERSRGRFEALVLKACTTPTPREMSFRGPAPGKKDACFTTCVEGIDETCPGLETNRPMWQAMREYINAPDTAARLQIVATTRDLFFLRRVQNCHYDECKSLPDLETVLEATRSRVREIALTDPDPGRRSFAVRDARIQGVRGDDVRRIAKNDPDPMVRKSAEGESRLSVVPVEEGPACGALHRFLAEGMAAVGLSTGAKPEHGTPADSLATIAPANLAAAADYAVALMEMLTRPSVDPRPRD